MARIKGSALHVYCAHLGKENLDRDSHPSIDWIMKATGLCRKTVYKGRRYLVQHGYLTKVGEVAPRIPNGRYKVPVMRSNSAWNNLLCDEKKVPKTPIVKSSTIDCNAFDFAFASGFASSFGDGSGHSNTEPEAKPTAGAVPPSAATEVPNNGKDLKSKSKSEQEQGSSSHGRNGVSGKRKQQFAPDGTPWLEEMYDRNYSSIKRLEWIMAHDGKPKISDLDRVVEPETPKQVDGICSICGNALSEKDKKGIPYSTMRQKGWTYPCSKCEPRHGDRLPAGSTHPEAGTCRLCNGLYVAGDGSFFDEELNLCSICMEEEDKRLEELDRLADEEAVSND